MYIHIYLLIQHAKFNKDDKSSFVNEQIQPGLCQKIKRLKNKIRSITVLRITQNFAFRRPYASQKRQSRHFYVFNIQIYFYKYIKYTKKKKCII